MVAGLLAPVVWAGPAHAGPATLTIPPPCTDLDNNAVSGHDMMLHVAETLNGGCRPATKENGTPIGQASATGGGPAGQAITSVTLHQDVQGTVWRPYCVGGWDPDRASNPGYPAGCPNPIPWKIATAVMEWPATIKSDTLYSLGHVPPGWLVETADSGWHYDTSLDFTLHRQGDCGMSNRANSSDLGAGGLTTTTCTYTVVWTTKPTTPTLLALPFYLHHGVDEAGAGGWLYVCWAGSCSSEVQALPIGVAAAVVPLITPVTGLAVSGVNVTSGVPIAGHPITLDVAVHNGTALPASTVKPKPLVLSPAGHVHLSKGPTPASVSTLAAGATTHFVYTLTADQAEDITVGAQATGTIDGAGKTTALVNQVITVHRGVTAMLTGPAHKPVAGTEFPVTMTVSNDSGHAQLITPGLLTTTSPGLTTGAASPTSLTVPDGSSAVVTYPASSATVGAVPLKSVFTAKDADAGTNQSVTATGSLDVVDVSIVVNTDSDEPELDTAATAKRCDVDASADGDQCTLRAAIQLANAVGADGKAQSIQFDIPGTGVPLISPTSALPSITVPTNVDASTQPGKWVQVSGAAIPSADGLTVDSSQTTIRGFVIGGFARAVWLDSGTGIVIAGNRIGVSTDGTEADAGDQNTIGIEVRSPGVTIGGTAGTVLGVCRGDCNLVGNNGNGILVDSGGSATVIGNFIGVDVNGVRALPNSVGVKVAANKNTAPGAVTIGGATKTPGRAPGNVISGNSSYSVLLNAGAKNVVAGNLIGLDSTGSRAIASAGSGVGVQVAIGVDAPWPVKAVIGGSSASDRNVISGFAHSSNLKSAPTAGVVVSSVPKNVDVTVENNRIGTDLDGENALPNAFGTLYASDVSANLISGNLTGVYGAKLVQGNRIGTNAAGTAAIPNNTGVSTAATVGGLRPAGSTSCSGPCNLISGNKFSGVQFADVVQGNFIGTNAGGTASIRNGTIKERYLNEDRIYGAVGRSKVIGGASNAMANGVCDRACNLISGNGGPGVDADANTVSVQGNLIGLGSSGRALSNATGLEDVGADSPIIGGDGDFGNRIEQNRSYAIDIWEQGTTPDSNFDVHGNSITGNGGGIHFRATQFGQHGLPVPVAPTATTAERGDGTVVASGRVPALTQGEAKRFFARIDVYASKSCEAGPQGAVPVASVRVGGPVYDGTWQAVLHGVASSLDVITATVTIDGVTSPFSPCGRVGVADPAGKLAHSSIAAGGSLPLTGSGFAANEPVTIVLHSKPKRLKTLKAGKDGRLRGKVRIPAGTKAGRHHVILRGTKSGFEVSLKLRVTKRA